MKKVKIMEGCWKKGGLHAHTLWSDGRSLNSNDLAKLEDVLLAELKTKMLGGVTLRANDNFDGGFRIATDNGTVYYDYSAEAVTDMLSNYLSPKVTALLKEAE